MAGALTVRASDAVTFSQISSRRQGTVHASTPDEKFAIKSVPLSPYHLLMAPVIPLWNIAFNNWIRTFNAATIYRIPNMGETRKSERFRNMLVTYDFCRTKGRLFTAAAHFEIEDQTLINRFAVRGESRAHNTNQIAERQIASLRWNFCRPAEYGTSALPFRLRKSHFILSRFINLRFMNF